MESIFGKNWRTTLGGILSGAPGLLMAAFIAAGITPGKWAVFAMTLSTGIGVMVLGSNSKDAQTHSTAEEVDSATKKLS